MKQLLLALLIAAIGTAAASWDIDLAVTREVSRAIGGEPFPYQPIITVRNTKGVQLLSILGTVHVDLCESPTGREQLRRDGVEPTNDDAEPYSVDVVGGEALFAELYVNEAGGDYRLRFVLKDEFGITLGSVVGSPFVVETGEPYQIGVIANPESAFGGTPWKTQPVVAVQDRGFNTLTQVNSGTVLAELVSSGSSDVLLRLSQGSSSTVPIESGVVRFDGLYINEAGLEYRVRFTTSMPLPGGTDCDSLVFSVGIGPAAKLTATTDPSHGLVSGGRAFPFQPRLHVVDAGGNILSNDYSSFIEASIYSNPSWGSLSPLLGVYAPVRGGVAQFENLSVDKAGVGYRLLYSFLERGENEARVDTDVQELGGFFDVGVGGPHRLAILRDPSTTWAGNQPFAVQPKVGLLDAGGNVVVGDSKSLVHAFLTPSLAHTSQIIIDTTQDSVPHVASVAFVDDIRGSTRLLYGSGDVLPIEVTFTQDAIVQCPANGPDDLTLPSMELNIVDDAIGPIYANALLRHESLESRTRKITFDYAVASDHSQLSVNYQSSNSLKANDCTITDAWSRNVSLELPSLDSGASLADSKALGIDNGPAFIAGIASDVADAGEYEFGAGQSIEFKLHFSREVSVMGSPRIPLNVKSAVVVIDTITMGRITPGSYFYIEYRGATTRSIQWDASADFVKFAVEQLTTVAGEVCVSQSTSPNSPTAGGHRWALRFEDLSEDPALDLFAIDFTEMRFLEPSGSEMVVSLQMAKSPSPDWTANSGDFDMCASRTALYKGGSEESILTFEYKIKPGDDAVRLDVETDSVTEILFPSMHDAVYSAVNYDSSVSNSADPFFRGQHISDSLNIMVDTFAPVVETILPRASTTPDGEYAVGDELYFDVSFNKPVQVDKGVELILDTGNVQGIAKYDSGSGTDTLVMKYVVSEGEVSSDLNYVDAQALVARNDGVEGYVRRLSTMPTTDAILDLPLIGSTLKDSSDIVIDGLIPTITGISFDAGYEGRTFIEREDIAIVVNFSSPVVVSGDPPVLVILIGGHEREAVYSSGSGSTSLWFVYTVMIGPSPDFRYRQLCLSSGCPNEGGTRGDIKRLSSSPVLDADLTLPSYGATDPLGISIDTSGAEPTTVVAVTTSTEGGTYGVGEEILLHIKFRDIVHCNGAKPKICTTIGQSNVAVPYESGSGSDTLTFRYVTTADDATARLDWTLCSGSTSSAIECSAVDDLPCTIQNANEEDALLSFSDVPSLDTDIVIDSTVPSIASVYIIKQRSQNCLENNPLKPSLEHCAFTVGETVPIFVKFDAPVVVGGPGPRLELNVMGEQAGSEEIQESGYAQFDPEHSNDTDLAFIYEVQTEHTSNGASLSYKCLPSDCSLSLGTDGLASIRRKASFPTTDAILTLPTNGISMDVLNPIIIDTSELPRVRQVSSLSQNGMYSPGDTIHIIIEFTEIVAVSGVPTLALDVGSEMIGFALYSSGNGSTQLVFEYAVLENHTALHLDYLNVHSLNPGNDGPHEGSIRFASTRPTILADLLLPVPGTVGSLAANSNLVVDSKAPYIVSLSSPNDTGRFAMGDTIIIRVGFSAPVVVTGAPYILLETGKVDGKASYATQLNESTLEFLYVVQLGEGSSDLDYWTDEGLSRSSSSSFILNGGSIKRQSASPMVDADLHLNPGHGFLDGTGTLKLSEGIAAYTDLKIGKRGDEYKVRFRSSPLYTETTLEAVATTSVGISSEYEIFGDQYDRDVGDLLGTSVSVDGELLAVGAPHKRNPTPEVQVVTVLSEALYVQNEVQLITTAVNITEATKQKQQFTTNANAGVQVGGTMLLSYYQDLTYLYASSVEINADTGPDQLKAIIEEAFPLLGEVTVDRTANDAYCKCTNAWTWIVTLLDASSTSSGLLRVDGTGLTGEGAEVSVPQLVRDTAMIGGSFYLVNPFNGARSRDIPYDASDVSMKDTIETDLAIKVQSVLVVDVDDNGHNLPQLGRRWTITFDSHKGEFGDDDVNVPNLEVNGDSLLGHDAMVWTHVAFEGQSPLSGHFALSLRGSAFSDYIPHDSSGDMIKLTLESLDSVNLVSVSPRKDSGFDSGRSGSSWTITFHSVNYKTDYGWMHDPGGESSRGNLPALELSNHLVGWKADYVVEHESGAGEMDTQAQWMEKKKGDAGFRSGAVVVLAKESEQWTRETKIVASDHTSHDAFGFSVSLQNPYLLVGAPSKEVDGLPEQQALRCSGPATAGTFSIRFRGFESDPIPFNATTRVIGAALQGVYGNTSKLHTLPNIEVAPFGGGWEGEVGGFCNGADGRQVLLTFFTPDGGGISTVHETSADIENVVADSSNLVGGSVAVTEVRKGTRSPMGVDLNQADPTGKQAGSAFLFHRSSLCEFCPHTWSQVMKFTPMAGLDSPTDTAQFGWSVAVGPALNGIHEIVAVGSPGLSDDSGKVYLFRGSGTAWNFDGALTSDAWTARSPGDRFGDSVQMEGDTILVSAPGHADARGAVYVFRQGEVGSKFLSSQAIYGPSDLSSGDMFGRSIALSGNNAVVCSPEKADKVIHAGTLPGAEPSTSVGVCYVYTREGAMSSYRLSQKLRGSNLKSGDRFGISAAMSGPRILIGQVQGFSGTLAPPRPVQVLRMNCAASTCPEPEEASFYLAWRQDSKKLQTRPLSLDVTANRLRDALEEDLKTGPVTVSRTFLPDENGGYSWEIVFDGFSSFSKRVSTMPVLSCELIGAPKPASCRVRVENDVPKNVRSKSHLFALESSSNVWTEQSFLLPRAPQRQDMFGSSVALDGDVAVVGASNRDLLNVNSGAAFAFDVSFLNFAFASSRSNVIEGDSLEVELSRKDLDQQQIVRLRSIERNADGNLQNFVDELFSFRSSELFPLDKTPIDMLEPNTAFGRSQYYGSIENRSLWVNGMFDYRGISDFALIDERVIFQPGQGNTSVLFQTTDDHIYENPDENVTLQVDLPGMYSSRLGNLTTRVCIKDNRDGYDEASQKKYYDKVFATDTSRLDRLGSAIDIDNDAGMMIIGSEWAYDLDEEGNELPRAGAAYVFERRDGSWIQSTRLSPGLAHAPSTDAFFGQSVAINKPYGRSDVTALVGSPGQAAAYVFVLNPASKSWEAQAMLEATDKVLTSEHRFAGAGSVALYADLAFVGSAIVETVYAYRRLVNRETGSIEWTSWASLRSSDYDFDVYDRGNTVRHMHRQDFGIALAADRRTLLVGAPFADYGNQGSSAQRESFNTDGLGKGKVFSFFSQPHIQRVVLQSGEVLSSGSFRLKLDNHPGDTSGVSALLKRDATAVEMKRALEEASNIGEVSVSFSATVDNQRADKYRTTWLITFLNEVCDDLPLLSPIWDNHGCMDCDPMEVSTLSTFAPTITATLHKTQSSFVEEGALQADDLSNANGFGMSLALDKNQAIIGAMHSAARSRTTWDFETGDLSGWSATGDAFDFQPTYGDNSIHRSVYQGFGDAKSETIGEPQSASMKGRYYVGTFERRPGNETDYQTSSSIFPKGSFRGDDPVGTLTSDPFVILGDSVSFLVGGGCDHLTEYVELLVDGFSAIRATGGCSERMDRVKWDMSDFIGRSAQIRIVDAGRGVWGHINVDDIQFTWDIWVGQCFDNTREECTDGGGALPRTSSGEKQHYTGREESPMAGAAYLFHRNCGPEDEGDLLIDACAWSQQQRIVASDKREENLFGFSVAVDDSLGIALVGSVHSPLYGFYQETPSIYPHIDPPAVKFPISEELEDFMKSGTTLSATGGNIRIVDHLTAQRRNGDGADADKEPQVQFSEKAGASYIFLRTPAEIGHDGEVTRPSYWRNTEDAKITPPDVATRDMFGYSVALDGATAAIGAVGDNGKRPGAGAGFIFDLLFKNIGFAQTEYAALEGCDKVKIYINRDARHSDSSLTIGYSTSDLTAIGVDALKFEECENLLLPRRDGCGDYEQTTGEVTFDAGVSSAYFEIRIVDDFYRERHMEYAQLNLHIPGAGPIHGERYRAQLRIDDDDWEEYDYLLRSHSAL